MLENEDMTSVGSPISSKRSALMASVRQKDTGPELVVRRCLHRLGFRFRLHRRDLPGTPDIVFPSPKKVIFVHGCFWHRHDGCRKATTPKTRTAFWMEKFEANKERDRCKSSQLDALGWNSLVVWECETKNIPKLEIILRSFLEAELTLTSAGKKNCTTK